MTEKANPSINRPAEAYKTAGAIAYGGHGGDGFVVDGASPTEISVQDGGITEADLNAFAETSGGGSLDVTIDGGEAFVFGSWLAIDTDTVVSLAASTAGQTVYVGWNKNGADDVIVGLDGAFSSASGDTDERIPLWTFDTDGSGVTSVTDERTIGYSIAVEGQATFGANADVTVSYDSANDELDVDGADLTVAGVNVVDSSQGYIPQASFENDDITLSAGTAMSGGGSVTLGNSVTINHGDTSSQGDVAADAGAAITDINLNPQGHVTSIGTTDFDSRFVLESGDTMSGGLTIGGDLTATNGETIWDESATYIPQGRLQNDSVTINSGTDLTGGGGVALGNSVTISHADTSSQGDVAAGAGAAITDIDLNPQGHVTNIGTTDFDGRFVLESGDTMSGTLGLSADSAIAFRGITGSANLRQGPFTDSNTGAALSEFDYGFDSRASGESWQNALGFVIGENDHYRFHDSNATGNVLLSIDRDRINMTNVAKLGLPERNSDPSANPGDMWYRSDLD